MSPGIKFLLCIFGPLGACILLIAAGAPDAGMLFLFPGIVMLVTGLVMLPLFGWPSFATPKSTNTSPPPPTSPPPKAPGPTTAPRGQRKEQRHAPPPPNPPPPPKSEPPKPAPTRLDYAHVLGLTDQFTFEDVKRHYRLRMKEYHPDRVAHLGVKLRELAEAETKNLNEAYAFFQRRQEAARNA